MKARRWAVALGLLGACGGERALSGLSEPLRVPGAVFKEGPLPGASPSASGAPGPRVTTLESVNNILRPRQGSKKIAGRTTADAYAVGLRFDDLGTGYWQLGVDAPDPTAGGELTWEAQCELGEGVTPGLHRLLFAAIDGEGRSGPQRELKVCVTPPYPDNLNACDPKIAPPGAVLALSWDTDVDLDLEVVTPGGQTLSSKHPTSAPLDDAGAPSLPATAPGVGVLDRDSNGGCAIDGVRREHAVWQAKPPAGTYLIYARLFDACGQGSARFVASLLLPEALPDGAGQRLVEALRVPGEVTAIDARGAGGAGLFVAEFSIR